MNTIFTLFVSLVLCLSLADGPHHAVTPCVECETAAPTANALERAVADRTAYLTDALWLRYVQFW